MTTKTVVCPECGSTADPGRYGCSECGALLAAVAVAPRLWAGLEDEFDSAAPSARLDVVASGPADGAEVATNGTPEPSPSRTPEPSGQLVAALEPAARREPPAPEPAEAAPEPAEVGPDRMVGATADPAESAEPPIAPAELDPVVEQAGPVEQASPVEPPDPVKPSDSVAPTWPPPDDRGVVAVPEPRTPAGAYLPPSAVLPPLDRPLAGAPALAGSGLAAATLSATLSTPAAAEPRRAFLDDLAGSLNLDSDTPRQVVAVGASVAVFGFLLPWANVLSGAGLLGGYFTQWGLAGPAGWAVVGLLIGIAIVALGQGRLAAVALDLPAVAMAALLVGVLWPYLFGVLGRSIGVWVVLAGAIVLAGGGLLARWRRHAPPEPPV